MTISRIAPLLLITLAAGCNSGGQDPAAGAPDEQAGTPAQTAPAADAVPDPVTVEEAWMTVRDEADNVDSVAVWTGPGGRNWLLATAKESHILIVYDAVTGERLFDIGGAGNAPGRLLRPNGISVAGDRAWVVERDNRRVQVLSLPDFEPLGAFGTDTLTKPYGLWVMRRPEGYRVFVTDAYETPGESVPPDERLDRRLHRYDITLDDTGLEVRYTGGLGPTSGPGVLKKVESLYGDADRNRLLVADEYSGELNIKLFDLAGRFTGDTLADGMLRYEPEGIALYACGRRRGYWFITDQDETDNRFLVLDRISLEPLGAFTGATTANTDGVWLHRRALPEYPGGLFYAVHDDGSVAAFDLDRILNALNLETCQAGD